MLNMLTETVTPIAYSSFESIISTLQSQISVSTVVPVLTSAAGVCVGLVFMWWGARKVSRMLMAAFKKGKISL